MATNQDALNMTDAFCLDNRRPNILLAVTGSVAGIKGPEIAVELVKHLHANVRVLLTKGGGSFWRKAKEYDSSYWNQMQLHVESASITVIDAADEWTAWHKVGDPVLHIGLRDWADCCLVAPLSANSLAKISHGMCDDTLSCVIRAWDFGNGPRCGKPLLLAPAMNTVMYEHPLTRAQLGKVQSFWNCDKSPNGVLVIDPQIKTLACGEVGNGALAPVSFIIDYTKQALQQILRNS